ncbi:MAG: hypothetical protein QXV75_08310 [Candidatus Bathyarchaeia archaeon]
MGSIDCKSLRACKCDPPEPIRVNCGWGNCEVWICARCRGLIFFRCGKCHNPYSR